MRFKLTDKRYTQAIAPVPGTALWAGTPADWQYTLMFGYMPVAAIVEWPPQNGMPAALGIEYTDEFATLPEAIKTLLAEIGEAAELAGDTADQTLETLNTELAKLAI